jgi:hypothetical protein
MWKVLCEECRLLQICIACQIANMDGNALLAANQKMYAGKDKEKQAD